MEKKTKSGKSKPRLAFYEPPACVIKTSSEIISEARAAIMHSGMPSTSANTAVIRPVNTKRPYTPRDGQRTLFGRTSINGQRPPSSFSLRYLQFQETTETGESSLLPPKKATHLMPIAGGGRNMNAEMVRERSIGRSAVDLGLLDDVDSVVDLSPSEPTISTRLPSISKLVDIQDSRRKRRHHFRAAASLDNLPEELELERTEGVHTSSSADTPVRKAYSSPKEHIERLSESLEASKNETPHPVNVSKISTTPRKVMKHDTVNVPEVSSPQNFNSLTSRTHHPKQNTLGDDTPGRSGSMTLIKSATDHEVSMTEMEQNLFGPHVRTSAPNLPNSTVQVDGGIFGEELHSKTGALNKTLESDGTRAVYDNHVNEAKLACTQLKSTDSAQKLKTVSIIQSILAQLNELADSGGADGVVMHHLEDLNAALRDRTISKKGEISSKLKTQILKCIYRFVERSEDALLLKLACIIFCLPVTGSNLSGVCKLVFKVSRSDKNDQLFMEGNILDMFVDALGSASPLEDAEACVYGYGALKFLTMNNQLLSRVLNLGTLDLMVLHLKIVNTARAEGGRVPEQTSHAVFQLTGALRNIAGEEAMFPLLVSRGAVTQLCQSMELFSADLDLITNIARTFSIISTNDQCCLAIVEYKNCVQLFAKLFGKYPGRQDIVVRLGYALGNLLAKSDKARLELLDAKGAMDSLLELLQLYLDKDLQLSSQEPGKFIYRQENMSVEAGSDGSVEDVIVKIVRIIANMSMNMEVGERLTCLPPDDSIPSKDEKTINSVTQEHLNHEDAAIGERAVDLLLTILRRKSIAESPELLLSTLSTLNNLTFYPSGTGRSVFQAHLMDLSQSLSALLSSSQDECLIETTKVLGNLSRSEPARDYLLETGGLHQLLRFLQLENSELLRTTTGVLVNLMADADKREALQQNQGVSRLIALLLRHGERDWSLSSLICQVLWNYCIDMTSLQERLGLDQTNQLLEVLVDYLDEDRLFGTPEEGEYNSNMESLMYQQWEEFAVIATNLLEKLESHMEGSHQSPLPHLAMNQLNIGANVVSSKESVACSTISVVENPEELTVSSLNGDLRTSVTTSHKRNILNNDCE